MMKTCFVCSGPAETEEHIIPKWLQRQYALWDQKLSLPNRTTITYKHLKIPCCFDCNNNVLSQLETKVKSGTATDEELWKWAAKIHFGLLRKDDFLEWDRKNPGYKIGDVIKQDDPFELDRHLAHSIHGEFETDPSPWGSVFRFKFDRPVDYHFAHLISPAGLAVAFGDVGYVIFVSDTGSLSRQPDVCRSYEFHRKDVHPGKMLNFFANSWVHLFRHRVSYPFLMTPNSIALLGSPKLIETLPFGDDDYRQLWSYITSNPDAKIVTTEEYQSRNGLP
ncbi:hypothetical protein [Alcanivorax sp. 1008]|uniref:hypothetical protein n=1 Tax=Alcanivorax sp. 1008 TaxID=2816853 RepID=UPI001DEBA416|nr:hypothetical protein [Alcanivorax sp. 1008]MCC1498074.1 hypothetical protein [Alcanivorax sp. 1008]